MLRAVSRFGPPTICLAQALTLQALQSRYGIRSDLAIFVACDNESGIAANSCLEVDGTMILGGEVRDLYIRLEV